MRTTFLCISILVVLRLDAATVGSRGPQTKAPWQWSDEERIAARVDAGLAVKRVQDANASPQEASSHRVVATARNLRLTDVIEGRKHPELFLPTELFEVVVREGLIWGDTWTEFYARQLSKAGLPPDF